MGTCRGCAIGRRLLYILVSYMFDLPHVWSLAEKIQNKNYLCVYCYLVFNYFDYLFLTSNCFVWRSSKCHTFVKTSDGGRMLLNLLQISKSTNVELFLRFESHVFLDLFHAPKAEKWLQNGRLAFSSCLNKASTTASEGLAICAFLIEHHSNYTFSHLAKIFDL